MKPTKRKVQNLKEQAIVSLIHTILIAKRIKQHQIRDTGATFDSLYSMIMEIIYFNYKNDSRM